MRRGDVVVVIMGGEIGKPRPALVVQADELGERTTTVLLCPMSSDTADTTLLRPQVEPSPENGLRARSQIMTDKLAAVSRTRIRDVIGHLEAAAMEDMDRALLVVLGLAR